ncbi:hypothetical protein PUNSTDRAFT_48752 [Punctularia strigosozonata HHB-11173 SS5]|uniref:uncharacterized protein n=1 Tax=Punctularia strigosozonata (strain HHB-11173) TaxID=741275 RepID=UPI00044163E7|nr:uncharacterized protein PUNSTDRAFT_48752 [Punctularia strigosozonata HHB-11173 SS5]EIN13843.1 hypothetical protein PUNSTDRAFT_48752 [Punctularia strigosozonata HHB-11173 SS5]
MLCSPPTMLSDEAYEELARYSRSLHEYTLKLWTESRRQAEERARQRPTTASPPRGRSTKRDVPLPRSSYDADA